MLPVAPSSSGPVCHQAQQQLHLCLTSSRSTSPGSRGPQSTLGGSGPTCLPTSSLIGQVVKLQDHPCNRLLLIAPGWSNMPWFWDLVTMSSQIPLCLHFLPTFGSAIQPDPSQEPGKSESTCLAPRAPASKEAGLP